jgi:valyl-tRNA synthetase
LSASLSVLLRLFAPFLPFVTEEVWSWWQHGSIHLAPWPAAGDLESLVGEIPGRVKEADESAYDWATEVLFEVRKQRSEAKQPLRVPISRVAVRATRAELDLMPVVQADLRSALRVRAFELIVGEPREILVLGYDVEEGPGGSRTGNAELPTP